MIFWLVLKLEINFFIINSFFSFINELIVNGNMQVNLYFICIHIDLLNHQHTYIFIYLLTQPHSPTYLSFTQC
jgi:hypothetical protein